MPFIAIGRYKTLSAMKVQVTLSDCTKAPLRESCRFVDFEIFRVFSPKLQNIKLWYKLNTSLSGDVPQQRFSENKSFNLIQEECRSLPLQELRRVLMGVREYQLSAKFWPKIQLSAKIRPNICYQLKLRDYLLI